MNLKAGFFNSVDGDRVYNANDMCKPYNRIVSDGVMAAAAGKLSTDYQVLASNELNLVVKQGFGIFNTHWAELEKDTSLTISQPDFYYPRIDSIIVRADEESRTVSLEYIQGTPAAKPTMPTLTRTALIKEYRLANVYVEANAVSISQAQITDTRAGSECGIITNLLADSDITSTYAQWEDQFNVWFENVKATLVSATALVTLTSKYTTTQQNEINIPINISRYANATDILQVYINGLICIPGVDYTITDYTSIKLKNGVDAGTLISFIVYKSVDTQDSETVITQVNELYERVEKLEGKNEALWIGAKPMGSGESITPSKKLSECNEGWILCFSAYDSTTNTVSNTRCKFVYIPKKYLNNASNFDITESFVYALAADGTIETTAKRLYVSDTQINGYAGNNATSYGNGIALTTVYEF